LTVFTSFDELDQCLLVFAQEVEQGRLQFPSFALDDQFFALDCKGDFFCMQL
jgi:hypothetical protein